MLLAASALTAYHIDASDGRMGKVLDLLFDDRTWKIRWIVVDTGSWLSTRKVLIHPSAVTRLDAATQELHVALTKAQVEGSPEIGQDAPVSLQMQDHVFDYYGWDRYWGPSYFGAEAVGLPLLQPPYGEQSEVEAAMRRDEEDHRTGDPHLRSVAAVTGYHIHATDGDIGHLSNLLIDDGGWTVQYVIVATSNWWVGKHVLVSPHAVTGADWLDRGVSVDIGREQIRSSPEWDPAALIDEAYRSRLHTHYGWPSHDARLLG